MPMLAAANVRLGSLADITARSRHVRFTLDSGHSSVQVGCPKSANSRRGKPPHRLVALKAADEMPRLPRAGQSAWQHAILNRTILDHVTLSGRKAYRPPSFPPLAT